MLSRALGLVGKAARRLRNEFSRLWWSQRLRQVGAASTLSWPVRIENPDRVVIGRDVTISEYGWFNCGGLLSGAGELRLEIGDGTYIGRFVHINARMSVVIERDVLIADRVLITDYHHGYASSDTPIIRQQLQSPRPVRLQRGCWIGEGAAIMPGVSVGANAIVGANAVVTADVPDGMVALGVPARVHSRTQAASLGRNR